jgi:hypothetical protein
MFVYLVRCENEKYFVAQYDDDKKDLNFFKNLKYTWLVTHKPISVDIPNEYNRSLDEYVIVYMRQLGVENVRGGKYSNAQLTQREINDIKKKFEKRRVQNDDSGCCCLWFTSNNCDEDVDCNNCCDGDNCCCDDGCNCSGNSDDDCC